MAVSVVDVRMGPTRSTNTTPTRSIVSIAVHPATAGDVLTLQPKHTDMAAEVAAVGAAARHRDEDVLILLLEPMNDRWLHNAIVEDDKVTKSWKT